MSSKKAKIINSIPSNNEGLSGSFRIGISQGKPTLFAKYKHMWYKIPMISLSQRYSPGIVKRNIVRPNANTGQEDSSNEPGMQIMLHQWEASSTSAFYIPFGSSSSEHTTVTDALNDDTLFIPPYNGELVKIVVHAAGDSSVVPGLVSISLRVNGETKTPAVNDLGLESSKFFNWNKHNKFKAGDRLRLEFTSTASAGEVTATSVWKYNVA